MAANALPSGIDALFTLAEDMADGCHTYEVAIGILQNTEARIRADLVAAQTAQTSFLTAKGAKPGFTTARQVADSNAQALIGLSRDVPAPSLGGQWSAAWEATGFPNQSLAVPSRSEERQALLASLQPYFTANPAKENAPLNVTAARAGTLFTALSDARSAANANLTDIGQKKALRDTTETRLRRRTRGLSDELGQLLEDDDPRWEAFGLVRPGGTDLPDRVEHLVLTASVPGTVLVD
ncbi:MAG: hypothetical protein HY000_00705 [Planctomycetes bacterium]|nr:hypothetical protein [Planctomycetota bacterium]